MCNEGNDGRIVERGLHQHALSGPVALVEGGQDAGSQVNTAENVHHRRTSFQRRTVRKAGCAHHPGHRLDHRVKGGIGAVRATQPVAGAGGVDKPWVQVLQHLIPQP